jgi:hypothetical protein
MVKLSQLDLLKFGHTVGMVGVVYAGEGRAFLALFPEERDLTAELENLSMGVEDWQKLMTQLDTLETEVTAREGDGTIKKAILRKSARTIEANISWRVFKRDSYKCCYCGKDDVPLTVDHIICWEEGGPSTPDNLLASCRKCNKARGNTPYAEWLESPYYRRVSVNLSAAVRSNNLDIVNRLADIPRKNYIKSR